MSLPRRSRLTHHNPERFPTLRARVRAALELD
jgi:hypothetical protein